MNAKRKTTAHGEGIFSRPINRTVNGAPLERFFGRVFIPETKRHHYFALGENLRKARSRWARILDDPMKALVERERKVRRHTFGEIVAEFLERYTPRGGTMDYYGQVTKTWLAYFPNGADPASIGRAQVEGYRDHLRQERYGDSTIRKYVGALGTMYRWAIGRGLLADNPAAGVKRPAEPSRIVAVLSREEEAALLSTADGDTRLAIDLYLASGMRLSEGTSLRWPQIDRAGGAILIHKSKTGKARSIPLNDRLTDILDRCTRHVRSDHVLCDREGNPLDRYTLPGRVESAMERAGIPKHRGTNLNLFRHTFGSRMAEAGVDMTTLATIMGNSPEVCYKHYIRFSPGHLKAAMALLDSSAAVARTVARGGSGVITAPEKPSQVDD